jgi:hypothetical protein
MLAQAARCRSFIQFQVFVRCFIMLYAYLSTGIIARLADICADSRASAVRASAALWIEERGCSSVQLPESDARTPGAGLVYHVCKFWPLQVTAQTAALVIGLMLV